MFDNRFCTRLLVLVSLLSRYYAFQTSLGTTTTRWRPTSFATGNGKQAGGLKVDGIQHAANYNCSGKHESLYMNNRSNNHNHHTVRSTCFDLKFRDLTKLDDMKIHCRTFSFTHMSYTFTISNRS